MLELTRPNGEKKIKLGPRQQIMDYYYLKYQHDHSFVIGDNKLKRDVEVMIGNQTLYCSFHDTRNSEQDANILDLSKCWMKYKISLLFFLSQPSVFSIRPV